MNVIEKLVIKLIERRYDKMFTAIRGILQGKKTYLVMVGVIVEAVIQYSVDGDLGTLITKIMAALGGITLKAGQARNEIPK